MRKLYAAYGSNLNHRQMAKRCENAKFAGTGVLKHYSLRFRGDPDQAFATVVADETGFVPVALWEISSEDEKALDRYEGVPFHYFKQEISVYLENGNTVGAMIYIMNPKMKCGLPSGQYYRGIYLGYEDCGFDTAVLNEALHISVNEFYDNAVKQPDFRLSADFFRT